MEKKAPTKKQLAARKKFTAMVKKKAAKKKASINDTIIRVPSKTRKVKKITLKRSNKGTFTKISGMLNKRKKADLKVIPSGHGHYKIFTNYYSKDISCITNNMQAIDDFKSEDGDKRIMKGYKSLRNECIRKNKI
jgi:hypothetical protein